MNKKTEILIAKYLSGNASSEEKSQILSWLEKDPSNQIFFDRSKKIWNESQGLKVEGEADVDSAWSDFVKRTEKPQARIIPMRSNFMKVAAGLVLVAALSVVVNFILSDTTEELPKIISLKDPVIPSPMPNEYELFIDSLLAMKDSELVFDEPLQKSYKKLITKNVVMITVSTGDTARAFMLPDNSIVFLNEHSTLIYPESFGIEGRQLTLSGEGYFEISRDAMPFEVSCLSTITSGTLASFNIRSNENEQLVEVIMASGNADFSGIGRREFKKLELKSGERATYDKNHKISKAKNSRKDYKWWQKKNLRASFKRFIQNVKNAFRGAN
ncbi:MAG: FecR family protein [bacterium]|nr:FecR family protein [bacterium]